MVNNLKKYSDVIKKLHSYRQKQKAVSLWQGIIVFLILGSTASFLIITIESVFNFPPPYRLIIVILFGIFLFLAFAFLVFRPLYRLIFQKNTPDNFHLALTVGQQFPEISDRMANAIQLENLEPNISKRFSPDLIKAAVLNLIDQVKDKDFNRTIRLDSLKKSTRLLAIGIVVLTVIWVTFNVQLQNSVIRLVHPSTVFQVGPVVNISIKPGNIKILKGESVAIKAVVSGDKVGTVTLSWRRAIGGDPEIRQLHSAVGDSFSYTLDSISDSIYYRVFCEFATSPEYKISVVELPMVRNLQVKLVYPNYSRMGTRLLEENVGDITALKGTGVYLSAKTNHPVKSARLEFDNGIKRNLIINGKKLDGSFKIEKDVKYKFAIADSNDNTNKSPLEYRVAAIEDKNPIVSIPIPGEDVDIDEEMVLPLRIIAEDDYGFSKLRLGYKVNRGSIPGADTSKIFQYTDLLIEKPNEPLLQKSIKWNISNFELLPEDVVVYFAQVFDNDNVSGPKSARSKIYRIRFPSIYEIYQEVAQTHEETFESMQSVYERTKELHERFETLMQEMKKDPELKWEERKEIEEAMDTQKMMQEELEELNQQLENMIDKMEKNDLVSMETLEKYQQLQELFQEIKSPELEQAMQKLQEAMQNIDPEELKKAAEKFNFSQEDVLKSIERTISLLKQLQVEQMMDEAIKKAEDLLDRQQKVNESNEKGDLSPEQLAQKEQLIQNDAEELREHLNNLQEKLKDIPELPQEGVKQASSLMDSTQLTQQMGNMQQQMKQGQQKNAQQTGNQISGNLQQLSQKLQDAKSQMGMGMQQQIMQAMRKNTLDLLELSRRQENLMNETRPLNRNSPQISEMAEKQQDLESALSRIADDIYDLSQKTMAMKPQLGMALGKSQENMNRALQALEQRNSNAAARSQEQGMASLNEAAKQMQNTMQAMNQMSGSGGMGMQQFMQRMQQMAQQQQGINQQTLGLGMGGQMSLAQQAAMKRLAAQQRAMGKSLEQLQQEMAGKSEILGSLDKIAQDMEDVAKDLHSQHVNQTTINRQQRILSRLLDAQRSVRRRDYSRKREAETGKTYLAKNPGRLPKDLGQHKNTLQEDLLRAQREGYSRDYLELIRLYFEALDKKENRDGN